MIKNTFRWFFGLLLMVSLCACGGRMQSVDQLATMSRDDFMSAMRWKQYPVAAAFMQQQEDREHFLKTFRELRDLHVTDVRMVDLKNYEQGKRFNVLMEMDYYLPPSVTLKTFTFDQTWVYFGDEDSPARGFQIVSPFPNFP